MLDPQVPEGQGQFIEICGLEGPVHEAYRYRTAQVVDVFDVERCELEEGLDANGLHGRCVGWHEDGQQYLVQTFDGPLLWVSHENLREYDPPDVESGGFDVVWPLGEVDGAVFAGMTVEALARKGFCVVQLPVGNWARREDILAAAEKLEFRVLEEELEAAYLGEDNTSKVAEFGRDSADPAANATLGDCDQLFTVVGRLLEPLAPSGLKFACCGRSSTLIRVPDTGTASASHLSRSEVEDGTVEGVLHFIKRRKVSMLHVVASDGGEVRLYPRDDQSWCESRVSIAGGNKLLLFRHDLMGYSYEPVGRSLALQSWLYSEPLALAFHHVEGGDAEERREIIGASGPIQPTDELAHVTAVAMRVAGCVSNSDQDWVMMLAGTDGVSRWPGERGWDEPLYYDPDETLAMATGRSYNNHGAFLELCQYDFDNLFFEFTDERAPGICPERRVMLEVGYECLRSAGRSRSDLRGAQLATVCAVYTTTWYEITPCRDELLWDNGADMMTAACVAQFVGSRGPVLRVDTACSSSMVATCTVHNYMMNHRKDHAALIMAAMPQLQPGSWAGLCGMGMLSHKGRCFTFDAASDGFAKGEGCSSAYVRWEGDESERWGTLAGSSLNQDGRSASMTAPNGPSQRELTRNSFASAQVTPADLSVSECHGTGTALGDPIEVGALRAAMDGFRGDTNPILLTTVKTNFSHTEANAGLSGVIKLCSILCHGTVLHSIHFRSLNPHLEMEGFPWYIISESSDPNRTDMYIGVQGFGMGGTNARADFFGRLKRGSKAPGMSRLVHSKADFATVPCPRCLGPMCWLCSAAVPQYVEEHSKHRCSLIRENFASYDYCSNCYEGTHVFGRVVEEPASHRDIKVYAVGTWSGWSTYHEMRAVQPGVYIFAVELGASLREQFHIVLNEDPDCAFYPIGKQASSFMRILGPDECVEGRHWLLDGRNDGAGAGTIYKVMFTWNERTGAKTLDWEVTDEDLPVGLIPPAYTHRFAAVGTWNAWIPQEMQPSPEDPDIQELEFRVGLSGSEEFQILQDADPAQVIHPATAKPKSTSVPVIGPHEGGRGKHWQVRGSVGEHVRIQASTKEDGFVVSVVSKTHGRATWETAPDYPMYHVIGSFNGWSLNDPMLPDETDPGVYYCCVSVGASELEEFQLVVDSDWSQRMHPAAAHAMQGGSVLVGPGDSGDGLNWLLLGAAGTTYVIEFDVKQEDRREMVRWRPVTVDWYEGEKPLVKRLLDTKARGKDPSVFGRRQAPETS